jgi:hypothetical protein
VCGALLFTMDELCEKFTAGRGVGEGHGRRD